MQNSYFNSGVVRGVETILQLVTFDEITETLQIMGKVLTFTDYFTEKFVPSCFLYSLSI